MNLMQDEPRNNPAIESIHLISNTTNLQHNQNALAMLRSFALIALCLLQQFVSGQTCTNLGQNPQTAFPVCGATVFTQNSVALCGNRAVTGPCGSGLTDRNPYWYKFTCYTSGTLGFVINPLAANEDYDWQLFNITGVSNLDAVYTNASLFVTCGWSQYYGATGASTVGTAAYACGGATPIFTRMPNITAGNDYLLLVSHWTATQSGYTLSFGGGTASITDTVQSHLAAATALCDATHINLKLNKKMKCNSLATNGSDFSISTTAATIIGATGFGCTSGFDMDSIQLTLSNPLPGGSYRIKAKLGSDLNTLLDICGTGMAVGDSVDAVVVAPQPVPMDSIQVARCSPQEITLQFPDFIRCSSIAADGSDFTITGPTAVQVVSATGICNAAGLTKTIKLNLAAPITTGGTYTLHLQNGTDGNTLLNDCARATAAGSTLPFVVSSAVSAAFTYNVGYNVCGATDTVHFAHPGGNGINQWAWNFNSGSAGSPATSAQQNPVVIYSTPGSYPQVTLIVTNGVCSDTAIQAVTVNAVQKDTLAPRLLAAVAPCGSSQMFVKLNRKIKCSSIAANGSDFSLRPATFPISSAAGIGCGTTGETDSLLLNFGSVLPTGNYTLVIKNGADGNTLADACGRTIPVNDSISNIPVVFHNTVALDSIDKIGCKPIELMLRFREPVRCSSIAADGSDFIITGPANTTIIGAAGNCNNGFTNTIKLTLAAMITKGGTYQLQLQNGTDGNTLLNECNTATAAGATIGFAAGDTVSAQFTYSIAYSCTGRDTVSFFHDGQHGVTQWKWNFGNGTSATLQNPVSRSLVYGTHLVSLAVSNGICADSATLPVFIATDTLHAGFEASAFLCPSEPLRIANSSRGNIASYQWSYGDGLTSNAPTPLVHTYPIPAVAEKIYNVTLTITGSMGCTADTTVKVKVLNNCTIAVPTAFTPNGDGLNDYLYPTNAYKADKLQFRVFNRFGALIFEAKGMGQKWDGRMNGNPQPTGAYVWMLNYINTDTGKPVSQRGTSVLIR